VLRRHCCPWMQAQAPSVGRGSLKCAWIIRARENQGNVGLGAYRPYSSALPAGCE
jgi:hypothetical protein